MFYVTQIITALACAITYTTTAPMSTSSNSTSNTGDMTYYTPGLGSCGSTNTEAEAVVALSPSQFTSNPDACGKTIQITQGGKTVTAQVVDKCPSCSPGSIDVSPTLFQSLSDLSVGRTEVTWSFK
ncbi:RlpA-like double-psi beta-barrel-protein domain-containing protein-containing protein [Whalleya microplaca]|nr:RlpA-like double-psi beta-barrel-protein domain-containing protein-containing protein [Whalleya microplaca]